MDSLEFSLLRKPRKSDYGHQRCVGHLKQQTLQTDTRGGTPARLLFKSAGDSVEGRNEFMRMLQYTRLVVRGSKEPEGVSSIPSKTPGDCFASPY